jgi:hypothetical protein
MFDNKEKSRLTPSEMYKWLRNTLKTNKAYIGKQLVWPVTNTEKDWAFAGFALTTMFIVDFLLLVLPSDKPSYFMLMGIMIWSLYGMVITILNEYYHYRQEENKKALEARQAQDEGYQHKLYIAARSRIQDQIGTEAALHQDRMFCFAYEQKNGVVR